MGRSQDGKAPGFEPGKRRFESYRPSQSGEGSSPCPGAGKKMHGEFEHYSYFCDILMGVFGIKRFVECGNVRCPKDRKEVGFKKCIQCKFGVGVQWPADLKADPDFIDCTWWNKNEGHVLGA